MRNVNLEIDNPNSNYNKTIFFKNWFIQRNLKIVEYQQDILSNKLIFNGEPIVLAVSPGGGKTLMSIAAIEKYCFDNPKHKVLVLTHGQTVLRSQYAKDIDDAKPNFSWSMVVSSIDPALEMPQIKSNDIVTSNKQVIISLPQSILKSLLPHFDLIVVDEAHQFYFAEMVKSIIKQVSPNHQLLLTGTPSPFIANGYKNIIPVSLEVLNENGMVCDPIIEIAGSTYDFKLSDYNAYNELKNDVIIKEEDTNSTLSLVLKEICKKIEVNANWENALKTLSKTMLVCKSQRQAIDASSFFKNENINFALSTSLTDSDSNEIERFKKEKDCLILIVVRRGILGFNYPSLINVIDMSCSQNINNILQLLCRVVRISPTNEQKLFFKVCPVELVDHFKYVMTAVLCMTNQEYFTKFNGKDFLDMKIPVTKQIIKFTANQTEKNKKNRNFRNNRSNFKPIEFLGLPAFNLFKKYTNDTNNNILNSYVYITLREVSKNVFSIKTLPKDEALEWCRNIYFECNCKSSADYKKIDSAGYIYIDQNNWLNEFYRICNIEHLETSRANLSKKAILDKCKNNYFRSKCKSMTDYKKTDASGYLYLHRKKWISEFYQVCGLKQRITIKRAHLSKEEILAECRKIFIENGCKSIADYEKVDASGYAYLKTKYWHDEFQQLCNLKKRVVIRRACLSKLELLELCKRNFVENGCKTMPDYLKIDMSGYNYLVRNGWLDEFYQVCGIKRLNLLWTKLTKAEVFELCKRRYDENGCKSIAEYRVVDSSGYKVLCLNKWTFEFRRCYNIKS
jgi:superfamily II DNA or RNA helicase